ncbi:hypothetical protein [Pelomonas sp. Root405]|nr:hypothetical protein [Pelomonas sp. Root405]
MTDPTIAACLVAGKVPLMSSPTSVRWCDLFERAELLNTVIFQAWQA